MIDVPEGAAFRVRAGGLELVRTASGWETGIMRADEIRVGGNAVVRGQQAAIASVSGGSVVDVQSRATIGLILSALRSHGLIAT